LRNIQIIEELIPNSDKIFITFGKINYEDRFCLIFKTKKIIDVDFIIVNLIKSIPKWFKFLLDLRNLIANIFGLKTGKFVKVYENEEISNFKQDQLIGDIFILLKEKNHLIVELKDKHLDFRFSIWIRQEDCKTKLSLSTIVKFNNIFGKIYFFLIKPFHRLIIPNILKKLSYEI
tara:strand:+ start:100 stop:624 length:525 start_codon:yes stop_codon:yes gene_type:complete